MYIRTLDVLIHDDLGFLNVRAVKLQGLLAGKALDLVAVVFAGVRRVLVTDRPSLKDTLPEML